MHDRYILKLNLLGVKEAAWSFWGVLKKQKRGSVNFFFPTEAILAFEQMKSGVSISDITGADSSVGFGRVKVELSFIVSIFLCIKWTLLVCCSEIPETAFMNG